MKKIVDFYLVEVKFSGKLSDYSKHDLYDMALVVQARRQDFTPAFSVNIDVEKFPEVDGNIDIIDDLQNEHLAIVKYSWIRQEVI